MIDFFLDEGDNLEFIFVVKYDFEVGKNYVFDVIGIFVGFGFFWNFNYLVYLEMMEKFDFIDGVFGKMDFVMYDG